MSQDTNVENLIINKLTRAQYESIANPDPTQLYFITDEVISSTDVTNALGYTPYNSSNPNGYTSNVGTVTSVNNIQPDANGNVVISTHNVGEVITSTLPLTDAGKHLLDGTLLPYGIYKEFIDYIADLYTENPSANYFCTENEWQTSVNTYGVCGKFVYDSVNNTVRLPKVTGIIEGTTDVSALGDLVEAGLPPHTHTRGTMNITGAFGFEAWSRYATGAFYKPGTGSKKAGTGNDGGSTGADTNFDASRSWTGSTSKGNYSSSLATTNTVQPQTIKCFVYIVIANSTKTDVQVDIDNIATDLNGKADTDLINATDQAKILMGSMAMPSNKYIKLTLGASGSKYIAPANGWFIFSKRGTATGQWLTADCGAQRQCYTSSSNGAEATIYMAVKKGDVLYLTYNLGGENMFSRFIYAQGSESEAS